MSLLATLVAYFRSRLGKLSRLNPLESGEVCYYQHWKRISVLVNFQNKYKLLDYIRYLKCYDYKTLEWIK